MTPQEQAVIDAALKYDDQRTGRVPLLASLDSRPDLADAVLEYRKSLLPSMPDRWARVYLTHTANPSWSTLEEALEPTQGGHIAVVRYVPDMNSMRYVGEWST